jgi:hypothetical protein
MRSDASVSNAGAQPGVGRLSARDLGWQLLLALALFVSAGALIAQGTDGVATAYLEGDRAAVIAFLPPGARDSAEPGETAARVQVQLALENAKRCLEEPEVVYRVVFADRIVIRRLGREESFQVSHFAPLAGGLLYRPGSNARILFAGGGPEALVQLLPSAASEYFRKKCNTG